MYGDTLLIGGSGRCDFAGGDPGADVPELQGIGVMSDGDQTGSISAADYAGFVLFK